MAEINTNSVIKIHFIFARRVVVVVDAATGLFKEYRVLIDLLRTALRLFLYMKQFFYIEKINIRVSLFLSRSFCYFLRV